MNEGFSNLYKLYWDMSMRSGDFSFDISESIHPQDGDRVDVVFTVRDRLDTYTFINTLWFGTSGPEYMQNWIDGICGEILALNDMESIRTLETKYREANDSQLFGEDPVYIRYPTTSASSEDSDT